MLVTDNTHAVIQAYEDGIQEIKDRLRTEGREKLAIYFMNYWGYHGEIPVDDAYGHADRILSALFDEERKNDGK